MSPPESIDMEDTQKFLPHEGSLKEKRIAFSGLTKEEVMMYANDPKWVRLRWILFALFWIIWIGMLVAAVLIVWIMPKCPYRPRQAWWEKEVVYQVDVAAFKDSGSDGVGDLKGLAEKLGYFTDLGIKTICLRGNIINKEDPKSLLPQFETEKFKEFQKAVKEKDMHVIVDMPFSYLRKNASVDPSNGKDTIRHWLHSYVDGVRITEVPNPANTGLLNEWTRLAKQVADETFERKFIGFYPLAYNESLAKPSVVIDSTFLDFDPEILRKNKSAFVANIQKIYQQATKDNLAPSFITGYYDRNRLKTKFGADQSLLGITHGLVLLLKGTPFVLYGDELEFDSSEALMKWDSSANCGFSPNATLAATTTGNCKNSAQNSLAQGAGETLMRLYNKLSKLREEPSFAWGAVKMAEDSNEHVLSFVRHADGFPGYLIAANVGNEPNVKDFKHVHKLPDVATVAYFYAHEERKMSEFVVDAEVATDRILLKPGDLLVVKFVEGAVKAQATQTSKLH